MAIEDPGTEGIAYDPDGYAAVKNSLKVNSLVYWAWFIAILAGLLVAQSIDSTALIVVTVLLGFIIPVVNYYRHNAIVVAHLERISLEREKRLMDQGKRATNNVTINLGNGASWVGPLAVGENIQQAYNAASSTEGALRKQLEETVAQVGKLINSLPDGERKQEVSTQLKMFAEESKKKEPSKWALEVSSKGLLEAATAVASLTAPVTTAVKGVLALLAP